LSAITTGSTEPGLRQCFRKSKTRKASALRVLAFRETYSASTGLPARINNNVIKMNAISANNGMVMNPNQFRKS
jgi:hypothetical protein